MGGGGGGGGCNSQMMAEGGGRAVTDVHCCWICEVSTAAILPLQILQG